MFSKTAFFLAFAAISSIVSAASPPGCLLGVVNSYPNPVDVAAVCKEKDATNKIAKLCGDATKDALSSFADICNKAGVQVSTDIPSATGTGGVANPTGSGYPTGTGVNNGTSPTGTPTGPGAPQGTGAAGKLEVGVVALFAGIGVLAAAL